MMLLSLWMTALTGAGQAAQDAGVRRRLHELRGRLGVREAAGPPGGVLRRIAWGKAQIERDEDQRLYETLVLQLFRARHGHTPADGAHDPAVEAFASWFAVQMRKGIRAGDLPWAREWRRITWAQDPVIEEWVDPIPLALTEGVVPPLRGISSYVAHCLYPLTNLFHTPCPLYVLFDATTRELCSWSTPFRLSLSLERTCHGASTHSLYADVMLQSVVFPHLVDWIEQTHPDLSRYTFVTADAAAEAWHREQVSLLGARSPVRVQKGDRVLHRFSDGATLVQLQSKQSLHDEGESMAHCVGGYWPRVREGKTEIWSYRDPNGVPQLTVELDPATKQIRQVQGVEDEAPILVGTREDPEMDTACLRTAWIWLQAVRGTLWTDEVFPRDVSYFGVPPLHVLNPAFLRVMDDLDRTAALEALSAIGAQVNTWGQRYVTIQLTPPGPDADLLALVNEAPAGSPNVTLDISRLQPFLSDLIALTGMKVPVLARNTGRSLVVGERRFGGTWFRLEVAWDALKAPPEDDLWLPPVFRVEGLYHVYGTQRRSMSAHGSAAQVVEGLRQSLEDTWSVADVSTVPDLSEETVKARFVRLASTYKVSFP